MSSIKRNFSYNMIYQILTIILPLITTPYISRIIGPEGLGIYSYTYSIVYYFIMFAMLGLSNYGNRTIAKARDNQIELNEKFSSIYIMQVITASCSTIFYIIYILFFEGNFKIYFCIQFIYLLATFFDINWLFFGLEKFKLTVTRNTIIKILSTISIFLFVKSKNDLILYMLILSAAQLISNIALWPFIRKYLKITSIKLKNVKIHIKPNLILFIPIIAISLYKIMDKIMLGNMTNVFQVGIYENAERIINVPIGLIAALGTVMLPRMSNLAQKGNKKKSLEYINKSMEFIMFLSIPICFGLIAVSKNFVPIYFGEQFLKTTDILIYLAVTVPFISWANVIRTQYLIPNEKDKIFIISVFLGAIINIILNYILIPKYQAVGAAIGTIFSEMIVMLYQTYKVREGIEFRRYCKYALKYTYKSLVMCFCVILIQDTIINQYITLLVQVLIGVGIYTILNYKFILKSVKSITDIKNINFFRKINSKVEDVR